MKKKYRFVFSLSIAFTLTVVCLAAFFYVRQLNRTISDNIFRTISEIAEHDKAAIATYIEICWDDLHEIQERFVSYDCKTIQDLETRMNLECSSSRFNHIYLVADDGTVYSDKYVTYVPGEEIINRNLDFLSYFDGGRDRVVVRFDDKVEEGWLLKENILYGIRLDNYEVEGVKMTALVGIADISSIQDSMVIDSFMKDGEIRGHSALIDMDGNYIIDVNKEIYLNRYKNLYEHLSGAMDSELTNDELKEKLNNLETFGFYHLHEGESSRELYYFMPFEDEIGLYFILSVNEDVFTEQTKEFVTLSIAMLTITIVLIVGMLLIVMGYQRKTVITTERARSQKEFLSNMSHEIRTPLNGLIGMNHLIMVHIDDESQKPQIKEWLKKSHSTANYLLSLVNDILDMSKLQAGKVDLVQEPLMISSLIDEIAAMQADNIKVRGVEFILEKDITVPCIEGDVTRIKQILMNIVGNAAKFTPEGKYIKLSVSQEKTNDMHVITTFRCEDAGIGISKEYIDKIFDSFSQERHRSTSGVKGTGLGMAISKRLANAMGGDITVESELNVGSTFTVTIPSVIVTDIPNYLIEDESENVEQEQKKLRNQETGRPIKILVAEDVELNAEILLEVLAMEGFETVHAKNGREAVDLFQKSEIGEFDLILMDMQMPVMDGCSASAEIRKLDRTDAKTVIIYACTANTFQEDRELALQSGMNDFLTKPIDINVLLKKIRRN